MVRTAKPGEKRETHQIAWGAQGHSVYVCVEHRLEIHGESDSLKHFRTHSWYDKYTPWAEYYERGLIKLMPNCHYLIQFCRRDHPLPKVARE